MRSKEELEKIIWEAQKELSALDQVVVIPAREYMELLEFVRRGSGGDGLLNAVWKNSLEGRLKAFYCPKSAADGLTQEQALDVLGWFTYMYERGSTSLNISECGRALANVLGRTWDAQSYYQYPGTWS